MKRKLSIIMALTLVMTMVLSITASAESYTIKSGDVLWKIAEMYDMSYEDLAAYNDLADPNMIYAGDTLDIPDSGKVTILHTNDMHGFFIEDSWNGSIGASKMMTVFEMYEEMNPNTLILDAGDATQGANLVTLSDGENAIEIMNALGYDAMTAGNHEFDYGSDQLLANVAMAEFPVLSANITVDADGSDFLTPYVIEMVGDMKVAIIGLSTPETTYKSHPKNTEGLTIADPFAAAAELVPMLDAQADIVIALVHLGDEGMYTSEKLAMEVDGIDLIIDGHSHSTYESGLVVDDAVIVSTGDKTKNVGVVDIMVVDGEVSSVAADLFTYEDTAEIVEDEEVAAIIAGIQEENAEIESVVVASTEELLLGERADVRTGETNLGNLIAEAFLDLSGSDVALTNGGGIRASIDVGDITKGEVITVLPFGNTVTTIEQTGAQILLALENGLGEYPEANGAFPHIAGMTVEFDSSKEAGSRVVKVMIGDAELDVEKVYTLTTNDFLAAGGDDYASFDGAKVVAEFGAMDEVLIDFINANGTAKGALTDRIKDVATE